MSEKIKVAIIQASPVFMNLEASLAKAVGLIGQAAGAVANLVALGETWLPGYPAWLDHCPGAALWNHEPTKQVFARLRQNSVVVPGKETARLGEAAREHNLILVIGVNEPVAHGPGNGTLFNSLLTFGPDGKLVNHMRNFVPTYSERLLLGQGDAAGLGAADTPLVRVSRLVC